MKIKKGDKVKILTGKDKGKTGKVLQVFVKENKVVIEGLNLLVKNVRPKKHGEKGQQVKFPTSINVSNVKLVCPHCGEVTKVGFKTVEKKTSEKVSLKNNKSRQCKKCQQLID